MKLLLVFIMSLSLIACTQSTSYGECVGLVGDRDESLVYEVSYWNAFVSFVFTETIIVPV